MLLLLPKVLRPLSPTHLKSKQLNPIKPNFIQIIFIATDKENMALTTQSLKM
jgi:hypothetical protein